MTKKVEVPASGTKCCRCYHAAKYREVGRTTSWYGEGAENRMRDWCGTHAPSRIGVRKAAAAVTRQLKQDIIRTGQDARYARQAAALAKAGFTRLNAHRCDFVTYDDTDGGKVNPCPGGEVHPWLNDKVGDWNVSVRFKSGIVLCTHHLKLMNPVARLLPVYRKGKRQQNITTQGGAE
jgi:hypothetical protein